MGGFCGEMGYGFGSPGGGGYGGGSYCGGGKGPDSYWLAPMVAAFEAEHPGVQHTPASLTCKAATDTELLAWLPADWTDADVNVARAWWARQRGEQFREAGSDFRQRSGN